MSKKVLIIDYPPGFDPLTRKCMLKTEQKFVEKCIDQIRQLQLGNVVINRIEKRNGQFYLVLKARKQNGNY